MILYHVSPGAKLLADFIEAAPVTTLLADATFTPNGTTLVDNDPNLVDPTLVTTDIQTDNGVIHAIDRVLIPDDLSAFTSLSITDVLAASGDFDDDASDFDILSNAVADAGLSETLAEADLNATVFAPNDAAFLGLAQNLGFEGTSESDAYDYIRNYLFGAIAGSPDIILENILGYHVTPGVLESTQVLAADSLDTILGPQVGVDGAALVDLNSGTPNASFAALDIEANNGIIHVIDNVLLPGDDLVASINEFDLIIGSGAEDNILSRGSVDFIDTKGGDDVIRAGKGDDTAFAGEGKDVVRGNAGDDLILGEGGKDELYGGKGDDTILGGKGDDTISGGKGDDILRGNAGDDVIEGGKGQDQLYGGNGEDTLSGGGKNDVLKGGADADTFVYATGDDRDRIVDFTDGEDMIDLSGTGITSFAELGGSINGLERSTNINFGEGDKLVLRGVDVEDLDADDFIFAAPVADDMMM